MTIFIPFSPTYRELALIVLLLSTIQFSIYALSPIYALFMIIEFLTTALLPMYIFLNRTELSTAPLTIHPGYYHGQQIVLVHKHNQSPQSQNLSTSLLRRVSRSGHTLCRQTSTVSLPRVRLSRRLPCAADSLSR